MKSLYEYLVNGSSYNIIPNDQRTGITNNILSNYIDYNVMLYSKGRYLPLTSLFYTARFNGYCVHADCRETLINQPGMNTKMSVNDITLHIVDQLGSQFNRNLVWGGQALPGIPHIYPFLTGYEVDFITRVYELSNNQVQPTFKRGSNDWGELATDFVANCVGGQDGVSRFPWAGIGEIIYYNSKRKAYNEELSLYAGKTPLTPIPEYIQFSQENPLHPIVQFHYWIGDDDSYNDFVNWASKNPQANIILCHGGFENGDNINDWLEKIVGMPKNVLVEISWTLLDTLYSNRDWIINELPNIHWVYGSDATPHSIKDGRDIDLDIDKLMQVSSLLHGRNLPTPGNTFYPYYRVPNGGDVKTGEQCI